MNTTELRESGKSAACALMAKFNDVADEIDSLRTKLDAMTAERNGLRIAMNDARSALKLWSRWDDMTGAELALALEATTAALAKAGAK